MISMKELFLLSLSDADLTSMAEWTISEGPKMDRRRRAS
jgi:hypothetical protein